MTRGSGRLDARQASSRRPRARWSVSALGFVLPALAVYAAFTLFPLAKSVFYSLYEWDGLGPRTWVGLDNYVTAFSTPLLRSSILNALKLIVFFSILPVALGLLLAAVIARHTGRKMALYRLVFFVPYVLPLVATGIIWRWMYNPRGIVNQALGLIGFDRFTRAWLGEVDFALIAVGLIGSWTLSGFCMMLFLAGAQRIDLSLYDAARIDGAGAYWQFRAVTLPGLRREISVALVVTTIAALASFDLVYVTTDGGPVNSTVVPSLLVYRLAFTEQKIGQAAALSMILTALVVVTMATVRRLSREPS
jgi:raffinose/stachyose/melibiose transport system permease protein